MKPNIVHNPDRYMIDLRQILSQGKKRIGLMVGAGAPVSIKVGDDGKLSNEGHHLIPDVAGLTTKVIDLLENDDKKVIKSLLPELGENPNIETILTKIRRLSQAIGSAKVHDIDGPGYHDIATHICSHIGTLVAASLPEEANPYTELVSWIGGTQRVYPVEIFTPNYDLLLEEAFERAQLPYFDGFSGAHRPFFDPTTVTADSLPARWSRLWKIHGSLGWDINGDTVIRTGDKNATQLIYPEHLKYDQITRQPYSALFERLREFLKTPDSLLICTGFSFFDSHISAVMDEALAANTHTAIIAFQYREIVREPYAVRLATRRPNMSVYASDGAVISSVSGNWQPGDAPNDEWLQIRKTFWNSGANENKGAFILGDFARLTLFFALSQSNDFAPARIEKVERQESVSERK